MQTGADSTFGALYVSVPATPGGFVETETITSVQSGLELPSSHIEENGFPGPEPEETRIFPIRSEPTPFGWNGGSVEIYGHCLSCGAGPYIGAHYIAATEVDPHPPTIGTPTGTALSGAVLRGHQTLDAEASDVGGGLTSFTVLANGLPAATPVTGPCAVAQVSNRSTYGTVAYSPTPCPPKLVGAWTLDTTAYPFHDGANQVSVCATDFSTVGNPNTTCSPPVSVSVDNSCTESPVSGGSAISAQFAGTDTEAVTVGYGTAAKVDGELRDGAGDPVSGATICVKSQTLGTGEAPAPVAAVKTDSEGRFAYAVPAGPDREVMLGYRHDSFQVARDVRYFAHVAPTLVASPTKLRNGSKVELTGALPQPSAARRVVVLQANVKGSRRWITFRRATSGERGGFKAGYLFHSTTRRTIYRFRAVVPAQDDYPYVEGHSKPVSVLVRPHRRHRHHQGG
ncbi:MAG TPA: hypothetical protein VHZ54_10425 [Solirubrobacterales bacterium]|nr:hypothetical protein [Solirubrobacterales bacterium]